MAKGEDKAEERGSGHVRHGTFVAVPLSFPSVSMPIDADASFITALALRPGSGRTVYGTTGGAAVHLFYSALAPPQGYVVDLGVPGPLTEAPALLIGPRAPRRGRTLLVGGTAPDGAALVSCSEVFGSDGIQEWDFARPAFTVLPWSDERRLLDLAWLVPGRRLCCLLERGLVVLEIAGEAVETVASHALEGPAVSRLGVGEGVVFFVDGAGRVRRVEADGQRCAAAPVQLPFAPGRAGFAPAGAAGWAVASAAGELYRLDASLRRVQRLGPVPVPPVHSLAALPDGRLYGLMGDGLGRFFAWLPEARRVVDLGVVTAVLGVKRYAYRFGPALVDPQGAVLFGEDDRGGHLWCYFPPLRSNGA